MCQCEMRLLNVGFFRLLVSVAGDFPDAVDLELPLSLPSLFSPPPLIPIPPKTKTPKKKEKRKKARKGSFASIFWRLSISSSNSSLDKRKNTTTLGDLQNTDAHTQTHSKRKGPPPPPPLPSRGVFLAIFSISQFQRGLTDEGTLSGLPSTARGLPVLLPYPSIIMISRPGLLGFRPQGRDNGRAWMFSPHIMPATFIAIHLC